MTLANNIYVVQIHFEKPISQCPDAVLAVKRCVIRDVMDGAETPYTLSFVYSQRAGAKSLLDRFKTASNHPDVRVVRVFQSGPNHASSLNFLDPIASQIEVAWNKIRNATKTKDLGRRNGVFVNKSKRAGRKPRSGLHRQR